MKHWTTALDTTDEWPFPITCEACEQSMCSICGHEPCPCCVDCCDHPACIEWDANGHGKKTHECQFTACPAHQP